MSELIELAVTNGKPTTTSLQIAERFGKQHKNVLQSIESLECPEDFNRLNFQPIAYTDDRNRIQPAYAITKDGFMFLAMGFTGKDAAAWKVRFIEAFNAMERQLLENIASQQVPRPGAPQTLSHRADNLVAASRTFNAMVRSSTAARIPLPTALRRAAEVTLRETGINMLEELQADEHLAAMEEAHAAKSALKHQPDIGNGVPASVASFRRVIEAGELDVFCTVPFLATQLYRMYLIWCRDNGVLYPVRMAVVIGDARGWGIYTPMRKRFADEMGRVGHQGSFFYPQGVSAPLDRYEPEWLGECVREVDAFLKELPA